MAEYELHGLLWALCGIVGFVILVLLLNKRNDPPLDPIAFIFGMVISIVFGPFSILVGFGRGVVDVVNYLRCK